MNSSIVLYFISLFFSFTLNAVSTLTQEQRNTMSTHIVCGYVTHATKKVQAGEDGFHDIYYKITMIVKKTIKTALEREEKIIPGQPVKFSYYKTDRKPFNSDGSTGQVKSIKPFTTVRVYMQKDCHGQYFLLEPNGFDEFTRIRQ
jgi:hypothetical protein